MSLDTPRGLTAAVLLPLRAALGAELGRRGTLLAAIGAELGSRSAARGRARRATHRRVALGRRRADAGVRLGRHVAASRRRHRARLALVLLVPLAGVGHDLLINLGH